MLDENKDYLGEEESVQPDTNPEAAEEAAEEITAPEEAPAEEVAEEVAEEAAEEAAEEIGEGTALFARQEQTIVYREPLTERLCVRCGENEKAEGSNYCVKCEEQVLSVKISAGAWIAGLLSMLAAVVGLVICFLNCAAALQVTKGDIEAANGCWYNAYNAYKDVDAVAAEINSTVGDYSPVIVGERVTVKKLVAMSKLYSPVDAGYSIEQEHLSLKGKYKELAACETAYADYYAVYGACSDALDAFTSGTIEYDEVVKKIDVAVASDDYDPCYAEYVKFSVANYADVSAGELLAILKECETLAPDRGWLYDVDFVDTYLALGDMESAEKYCDKMIARNKNDGETYYKKLMITMLRDDEAAAKKLCDEFENSNPDHETVYTMRVASLRRFGNIDGAAELCREGIDKFQSVAEHYRQLAIICILQGDYDAAFDAAYQADYMAYSVYYYSGDGSAYTSQLSDIVYLSAMLCKQYGKGTGENSANVQEFIDSFESELDSVSPSVKAILDGTKTPEEVFMKGTGDVE